MRLPSNLTVGFCAACRRSVATSLTIWLCRCGETDFEAYRGFVGPLVRLAAVGGSPKVVYMALLTVGSVAHSSPQLKAAVLANIPHRDLFETLDACAQLGDPDVRAVAAEVRRVFE